MRTTGESRCRWTESSSSSLNSSSVRYVQFRVNKIRRPSFLRKGDLFSWKEINFHFLGSGMIKWPYINSETRLVKMIDVPVDVLLSVPMFLRSYLLCRFMVLHSKQFQVWFERIDSLWKKSIIQKTNNSKT